MAMKQAPRRYIKKTFEQEALQRAKMASEEALLGSDNETGYESCVCQFLSRRADSQVKNLFLVGEMTAESEITVVVESPDVGEGWGREDMLLDMSRWSYRALYLCAAASFDGAVYLVNAMLNKEEEGWWWLMLRLSTTPPSSLFFLHRFKSDRHSESLDTCMVLMTILHQNRRTRNLILFKSDIAFEFQQGSSMAAVSLDNLHLEDVSFNPEFLKALNNSSITQSLTLALQHRRIFADEMDFEAHRWHSYQLHQLLEKQLKYLALSNFVTDAQDLIQFMSCLKNCTNSSLSGLSLSNLHFSPQNDQEQSALVNVTVDALHHSGLRFLDFDLSDAAIEAQLLLNQERLSSIGLKHLQQLNKVPATAVRLFICGDAYAGKSTLLSTLSSVCFQTDVQEKMQVVSAFHKLREAVKACFTCHGACSGTVECTQGVTQVDALCSRSRTLERTRGIEVHAIVRGGIQVSVWDMAGQKEFHCFHDHMFPDSMTSSPAMFMFVWSPLDTGDQELGKNYKTMDAFEASFSYWLKFIASKTRQSSVLRKLFVVLTHKDKLDFVQDALAASINDIAASFGKIIQVVEVMEVDARCPTSVMPLASCIFDTARDALHGVEVYDICNEVRRFLSLRHPHDLLIQDQPIIPWTTFSKICEDKFNVRDMDIQKAIAYTLNESGDLIFLSNLSFIVIDPNWFCNEVMGSLIHFPESYPPSTAFFPIHGYANQQHLEKLLKRSTQSKVEGNVLVDLLEAMQLCCKVPDDANGMVFIPATLSKTSRNEGLQWRGAADGPIRKYAYLGRRLECDKKDLTFLTPGLFPMIQVVFKKAFSGSKADVELNKDVISICVQDMEIIVELGLAKRQHFIDVMVRAPDQGDARNTLAYVEDEIIRTLIRVCAQPVGNQGVKLIEGVIRPDCLRDPAPSHVREDQCVLVIDLKRELRKQLEGGRWKEELLHLWQGNDYVEPISNRLVDLLGLDKYKEELIAFESSLQDALLLSDPNGKEGADSERFSNVIKSEVEPVIPHVGQGNPYNPQIHDQVGKTEQGLEVSADEDGEEIVAAVSTDEVSTDEDGEEIVVAVSKSMVRAIYREMKSMNLKLESLSDSVRTMHEDMYIELDGIHGKVENLRRDVLPKIQKSVEQSLLFSVENEAGKVPRFVFLTTSDHNGTMTRMVTAVFRELKRVHIELFCEHRNAPHRVDGQRGLLITTMDEGTSIKRALPYVNGFLKVLTLVAKVGSHVIAGAGSAIPDFSQLIGCAFDTPGFLDNQGLLSNVSTSPSTAETFTGWQQWLVSVLQKHGGMQETNIYNKFKLRRALYQDTKKVAWLCNTHYKQQTPLPLA